MNDFGSIYRYAQELIDGTTRNTTDSLDFLEGFVYALLMIQERAKILNNATKEN